MSENSTQKTTDKKETPKGENPPESKIAEKSREENGKTFQGTGKEIKK